MTEPDYILTQADFDGWIEDLPKAKKGKGALCNAEDEKCCLGVLAERMGDLSEERNANGDRYISSSGNGGLAERGGYYLYGLDEQTQHELAHINDTSDTFEPVIEHIQKLRKMETFNA